MQSPITNSFLALLLLFSLSTNASLIFINEFHYDNVGSDNNEFIEVAGLAGLDLTDWSLLLYNGSNGTIYGSINLSGHLSNSTKNLGFASFNYAGIQNGSPDGIALVDNLNFVHQFISYEGSFTAIEGAAIGLISQNILLSESNITPAGYSLQLAGKGTKYKDFFWQRAEASKGNVNIGQQIELNQVPFPVPEPNTLPLSCIALFLFRKLRKANK